MRLVRFFGLVRPCSVGAVSCCLVVVTAADRAAATCPTLGGEAASLREAPLPSPPSPEEQLGIGLCVSSDLCAHAAWVRFLAAWLWSRRLTEPPRTLPTLGERPLLREKRLSQPPLSRRAAGNRLVRFFGLVRPCSVGAVSCCLVVITAADRAAATCRRWGRGASLREAPIPSPPLPKSGWE